MKLYVWKTGCITEAWGAGCVVAVGGTLNAARARALKAVFKLEARESALPYVRDAANIIRETAPETYPFDAGFAFDAPE